MFHDRAAWRCAFFVGKKKNGSKGYPQRNATHVGEHCLSRQAFHNCVQQFSEGRTNIEDEHRAGRPVEIATPVKLQRVEDIIRAERRVTVNAVATAIGCSRGQASTKCAPAGCHAILHYNTKARGWACHCSISSATRMKGTTCFLGSSLVISLGCTIMSPRRSVPPCSGNTPRLQRTRCLSWKNSARVVPTATKRILRRTFPGTCETVGQVFKFVWRLCWKINVVCMSLTPFYSFQSRFVTYLLNRPRTTI